MTLFSAVVVLFPLAAAAQLPPWAFAPAKKPEILRAQPPPSPPAITLRAQTLVVVRATKDRWRAEWGSYISDYARMQHVEISGVLWSHGEIDVEMIWFGRELGGQKRRVIIKTETKPWSPQPIIFSSGIVENTKARLLALGVKSDSGMRIEGWRAIARDKSGRELHRIASLPELLR